MDVSSLQLQEEPVPHASVELVRLTPREQVQQRTAEHSVEQVVGVPMPEFLEKSLDAVRLASKERVHQRTLERNGTASPLAWSVGKHAERFCAEERTGRLVENRSPRKEGWMLDREDYVAAVYSAGG